VDEVPGPQRPLLALGDQQCLPGEHEEVLLVGLPVVHRHRLARPEDAKVDPELRELPLALELRVPAAPVNVPPDRVARVEHEPAVVRRNHSVFRLLEPRLLDHGR
jgi:hypothetical protein